MPKETKIGDDLYVSFRNGKIAIYRPKTYQIPEHAELTIDEFGELLKFARNLTGASME